MIAFLLILGTIVAFAAVVGLIVQALWNWIMPYLFGLPTISFWMAWGILILVGLFFSGLNSRKK